MFSLGKFGRLRGNGRGEGPKGLRVIVVSTPRSGNTWLRHQLNNLYGFNSRPRGELAVHEPGHVPWGDLPADCVLELHWRRAEPLTALVRTHGFRVVTLARHPLAVLISILQYAQHIDETVKWLRGEGGDESSLVGATPCSEAFLRYATSPRAAALLSVSPMWWRAPGVVRVRYEDLVRDGSGALRRLTRALAPAPVDRIMQAVHTCTIDHLRRPDNAPHFWQGSPDLWRSLLTADSARRIHAAHPRVFRALGYRCDPDPSLTVARADAEWRRLAATVQ
jgi:hypothetical protein